MRRAVAGYTAVIIASDQLGAVGVLQATYQQAVARLTQARVNLQRTEIRSAVNGYVTNLLVQLGDYVTVGKNIISLVDADSYWVDGYFEETNLEPIRVGDAATIKLMGYSQSLRGQVDSIARGINVANAQPNGQGLATPSTRSSPGCSWRSAFRCASTSTRCRQTPYWWRG
ncbi:MAG TPA: efflux RND transporter periplasmic adaptor subunit [Candidatus Sulfotelmatobacter sp.]